MKYYEFISNSSMRQRNLEKNYLNKYYMFISNMTYME